MSLKPPKKSDLDKGWMKARRDKPKKIQPEYHLIVTEGTDTEPAYFGAMKDIINSAYPDRIQLSIHGAGDNTLNLFQKARQLATTSANGYKHVWIMTELLSFQGFGSYEKNRTDMFKILAPYLDTAIVNAEKLEKINTGKLPSDSAPGTMVHVLVKKLRPYLKMD